jgi:hypothetical protein
MEILKITHHLAKIFIVVLTLWIFLLAGAFPASGRVVFPKEIGGLLYEANQANQIKT